MSRALGAGQRQDHIKLCSSEILSAADVSKGTRTNLWIRG